MQRYQLLLGCFVLICLQGQYPSVDFLIIAYIINITCHCKLGFFFKFEFESS